MPAVAFRVWAAQKSVDVLVCFRCDQLLIGPSIATLTSDALLADFDPARAALVSLAHEALPGVPRIQSIPTRPPDHGSPFE
jgi:hypothetical protein